MEMRPLEENTEREKSVSLVMKPEEMGGRQALFAPGQHLWTKCRNGPDLQRIMLSLTGLGLSG